MIVPWLKGFLSLDKVPLTWAIIFTNIFIFVLVQDPKRDRSLDIVRQTEHFEMTAKLYHQYKGGIGLPPQADLRLLGLQAYRDYQFINNIDSYYFYGDEIAIDRWKSEVKMIKEKLSQRSVNIFGLQHHQQKPVTLITYQFMHAGLIHLISNCVMILIFAGALELIIGSLGLVIVYLVSGFAGAFGFLMLGDSSVAPLVGASGALSGIMAFYIIAERKRRVPFFYFLSPLEGYFGWIWLPTWLIFPLSFVSDIASYLSTSMEIGSGVAYSAHIGGMLFGLAAGMAYRLGFKLSYSESK